MFSLQSNRSRLAAGFATFLASAVVVLTVGNAQAQPEELPSQQFGIPTGVTADGRTYGSQADVQLGQPMPDLISVVGDSGELGFVEEKRIRSLGESRDPAENARNFAAKNRGELSLPVYAKDGVTRIDTFTIGDKPGFVTTYTE